MNLNIISLPVRRVVQALEKAQGSQVHVLNEVVKGALQQPILSE